MGSQGPSSPHWSWEVSYLQGSCPVSGKAPPLSLPVLIPSHHPSLLSLLCPSSLLPALPSSRFWSRACATLSTRTKQTNPINWSSYDGHASNHSKTSWTERMNWKPSDGGAFSQHLGQHPARIRTLLARSTMIKLRSLGCVWESSRRSSEEGICLHCSLDNKRSRQGTGG